MGADATDQTDKITPLLRHTIIPLLLRCFGRAGVLKTPTWSANSWRQKSKA